MLVSEPKITTTSWTCRIGGRGGHQLGLIEKEAIAGIANDRPPVLLVHGATLSAALFDIPVQGHSLMSALAASNTQVFAIDIRGYGHSLAQPVMDERPEDNPPFARLEDAVDDVASAVEFICGRTGSKTVDLVGFSWGTVICGKYCERDRERVRRLVLYAPLFGEKNELWRERIGDPKDRSQIAPGIGAYRFVARDDIRKRWDADIGSANPEERRDDAVLDAVFEAHRRMDQQAGGRTPPAFRSPAGALADLIHIFNGKALFDPSRIDMPTLLVRGADDTTSTESDAKALLAAIPASYKRYDVIRPGSHFLCIEKNGRELHQSIGRFLESTEF